MPPPNFAARFAAAVGADNVAADSAARFAYAADNSRRAHPPDAVVFPKNEKEVAHIIRLANEFRIPIIPRGRGTGTAGGAIAEGGGGHFIHRKNDGNRISQRRFSNNKSRPRRA